MRGNYWLACTVLVSLIHPSATQASSSIDWSLMGSGGGFAASPSVSILGAIGESLAGPSVGPMHSMEAGFASCFALAALVDVSTALPPMMSRLAAIAPNPFRSDVAIVFEIHSVTRASVRIFDTNGRLVTVLSDRILAPGRHTLHWDATANNGKQVPAGVYYCILHSETNEQMRKLAYVR